MVSAKVVATYSMGVVLVFTVRIRTILQLHPCFKAYLSGIESQPLIFIMMMPSYQMLAFDHAYNGTAKAQANLHTCAGAREPLQLAFTKYGCR